VVNFWNFLGLAIVLEIADHSVENLDILEDRRQTASNGMVKDD
jgi:hypothetical protein